MIDQFFTLILRYIYNSRLLNKTMTLSFIKYTRLEMFIGKKNETTYEEKDAIAITTMEIEFSHQSSRCEAAYA